MLFQKPTPLLLLGAVPGLSKPLKVLPRAPGHDQETLDNLDSTWKDFTADELCNKYNPEYNNDPNLAEPLWTEVGVGKWFDEWLSTLDDKSFWTATMDMEAHRNGGSRYDCQDIDSTDCGTPDDCRFYYEQGMGPAYWILYSAARLHGGLNKIHEELQDATINSTLQIDQMIEKFGAGEPEEDLNMMAVLNAAFTVAAGAVSPLTGPLTVVAGAFGMASQFTETPPDPSAALKLQLSQGFTQSIESLERTTKLIFGGEGAVDEDREHLPMKIGDYQTALARFFAEGKFLGKGFNQDLDAIREEYGKRHQQALSGTFIKTMGYAVVMANNLDQDSCPDMHSSYWQEATSRCFMVMKPKIDKVPDAPSLHTGDGPMSVAMYDYGVDKDEFYSNAYGCAEASPDEVGKVSGFMADMPKDGTLPTCFFGVPLVEGKVEMNDRGDAGYIYEMSKNTVGMTGDDSDNEWPDLPNTNCC